MKRTATALALGLAALLSLSACGAKAVAPGLAKVQLQRTVGARSVPTLQLYPEMIAQWLVRQMDLNGDGVVNEAEAQTRGFSRETFNEMDLAVSREVLDGHITPIEMATYLGLETSGGLTISELRRLMGEAYGRADATKNGMVEAQEALAPGAIPPAFTGTLKVNAPSGNATPQDVAAADFTRDGVLTRAEFEDLCVIVTRRVLGLSMGPFNPLNQGPKS